MPPTVTVLLFASAREAVGRSELRLEVPADGIGVHQLLEQLKASHPRLGPVLAVSRLVRNGEYLPNARTRLQPRDELAIHPPYSGG